MKKYTLVIMLLVMGLFSGCATTERLAPCTHFGAHCLQTPINE